MNVRFLLAPTVDRKALQHRCHQSLLGCGTHRFISTDFGLRSNHRARETELLKVLAELDSLLALATPALGPIDKNTVKPAAIQQSDLSQADVPLKPKSASVPAPMTMSVANSGTGAPLEQRHRTTGPLQPPDRPKIASDGSAQGSDKPRLASESRDSTGAPARKKVS